MVIVILTIFFIIVAGVGLFGGTNSRGVSPSWLSSHAVEISNNESVKRIIENVKKDVSRKIGSNYYDKPSEKEYVKVNKYLAYYIFFGKKGEVLDESRYADCDGWYEEIYSNGQKVFLTETDARDLADIIGNTVIEYCNNTDDDTDVTVTDVKKEKITYKSQNVDDHYKVRITISHRQKCTNVAKVGL